MLDLTKIDLGSDEAEQDLRLKDYFLKTQYYKNALVGSKTLIVGRKGSGKSAIFTLLKTDLSTNSSHVIPITPDQYAWGTLKAYAELGIMPEQAHTNSWRLTLLSAVVAKLNEHGLIPSGSRLKPLYAKLNSALDLSEKGLLNRVVDRVKDIKLWQVGLGFKDGGSVTPLRIVDEIVEALKSDWPNYPVDRKVRIIVDRLDDSWDASAQSRSLMVGILKAAHELNAKLAGRVIVTTFLRSDIYDHLYFDDQDKLRQSEEKLLWPDKELTDVVSERVRVSLQLPTSASVWQELFSDAPYRSNASAEKFIIDRTFKRPRDVISFVRSALEVAVKNGHKAIEPVDVQTAEEQVYSAAKYKDLIIEYQKQFPYVKGLLDSFNGSLHKLSKGDVESRIERAIQSQGVDVQPSQVLRFLFEAGVIGIKRKGGASIAKKRGGEHFYYYYDDQAVNPSSFDDFFIHPALRKHLGISEKRERNAAGEERLKVPKSTGGKKPPKITE